MWYSNFILLFPLLLLLLETGFHYVGLAGLEQAGLELTEIHQTLVSWVLVCKVCTAVASQSSFLNLVNLFKQFLCCWFLSTWHSWRHLGRRDLNWESVPTRLACGLACELSSWLMGEVGGPSSLWAEQTLRWVREQTKQAWEKRSSVWDPGSRETK